MTGQWKPGDVGISIAFGYRGIFISGTCPTHDRVGCWHNESGFADPSSDGRRPAVVIDPEDRQAVERLILAMPANRDWYFAHTGVDGNPVVDEYAADNVQAALREFAAPTPPRPNEPKSLGAVVEDRFGNKWVRVYDGVGEGAAWYCDLPMPLTESGVQDRHYADIDVVRVLSEGIEQP